jgi:hypothetical protein
MQMLSGLYVDCFGDSLVEDVSVLVHDTGCSGTVRLKCDSTRPETRFRLSPKRTSPFKSAGGVRSVDCWQLRCAHQR